MATKVMTQPMRGRPNFRLSVIQKIALVQGSVG